MLIKELKSNTFFNMKVKIDKFIDRGERYVEKKKKNIKFEKWEVVDEENNRILCTFWDEENILRLNNNIGKWVMLNNFGCQEYEGVKAISSSVYGFIKPIGGLY